MKKIVNSILTVIGVVLLAITSYSIASYGYLKLYFKNK